MTSRKGYFAFALLGRSTQFACPSCVESSFQQILVEGNGTSTRLKPVHTEQSTDFPAFIQTGDNVYINNPTRPDV